MLIQEIDLLDIIHQLRILKLMTFNQTTINQRQLVRFLEKYCINSSVRYHNQALVKYWQDP